MDLLTRNDLALCEVLVECDWIIEPSNVKKEFLNHFVNWFSDPVTPRFILETQFSNRLPRIRKMTLKGMLLMIRLRERFGIVVFIKDMLNFTTIVNVLKCFFMDSNLKINLHKSKLMCIDIPQDVMDSAAKFIGCSTLSRLLTILVSKWVVLCRDLALGMRNYFNGVENTDMRISWIGLKKILASKKNRGLGVSSFFALNRALLFNWIWTVRSSSTGFGVSFPMALPYGLNL
ncbi:hypothetical protein Tco_0305371 [Tanacetum coccineum]